MSEHAEEHHVQPALGHAELWGDYNSRPAEPSTLPPLSPWALALFGVALGLLLAVLAMSSFSFATARHNEQVIEQPAGKQH
jgi:hypothetical protein